MVMIHRGSACLLGFSAGILDSSHSYVLAVDILPESPEQLKAAVVADTPMTVITAQVEIEHIL